MANAIKLLQDDHNSVRMICRQLPTIQSGAGDEEEKAALQLVSLLETHTTLIEELVYPVLADAHPQVIKESEDAHDKAAAIVADIKKMPAGMELRETVQNLQAVFEVQAEREETTIFPLLTETLGLSGLEDLGHKMMGRQQELMQAAESTTGASATGMPKNVYPKL